MMDDKPIARTHLFIPEVVAETLPFDPLESMRPVFDAIWNAGGYSRSFSYSEAGEWMGIPY